MFLNLNLSIKGGFFIKAVKQKLASWDGKLYKNSSIVISLMIDKTSFNMFSIRWLFQYVDGMIRIKKLNGVEEIYNQVELLCTPEVPYNECFKETLNCRKENSNFQIANIIKQQTVEEKSTELLFSEFLKGRKKIFLNTARSKTSKIHSRKPKSKNYF
ncbi:CLUMA_CG011423, isoform A [Clunio marinus]|uniref:CLUMA_CG011423, isoform A n=1 Tax=Clunio marinus TaxID=568069 RepID=A0A1J1IG86_9DIPT|nr:CLUMA_CG011423, isoform A [Clunio marinus]